MGKHFVVEIRTDCAICGGELPTTKHRTYCSDGCRAKRNYQHHKKNVLEWQNKKRGEYKEGKIACLFCGRYYVQVGSHVRQTHKIEAQKYKAFFDLPISRGIIPRWYRELKGKIALDNGTYKNLELGEKTRYEKGDYRAKAVTGRKGRDGAKGYSEY